jgi:hypothetical protein
MEMLGIDETFRKSVMSTNDGAYIEIDANGTKMGKIRIGKGVKQGCPLSPTLFNLGIDPLLRYIKKEFGHLGYHYGKENEKIRVIQAYADDLLVFSENKEDLNQIVSALTTYMSFAGICFNPDKCKLIVNNASNDFVAELTLPNEFGQEQVVERCEANQTIKYLGAPLGTKRLSKMRFNNSKIESVKKILSRLDRSVLKITQIVDAIRTFVIPKLDYCFMNNIVSLVRIA